MRVHFPDVVKVTMRHRLLRRQLPEFVQENVQLELGGQVAQSTIAKGLPVLIISLSK